MKFLSIWTPDPKTARLPPSKELIAGFAILQAKLKEEAIEAAKRFHKVAGDGESELRQIMDGADGDFATR